MTAKHIVLYLMHESKKKNELNDFSYVDSSTLSYLLFFSYILPHGNFITYKIKSKESFRIKDNKRHLLPGEYLLCD